MATQQYTHTILSLSLSHTHTHYTASHSYLVGLPVLLSPQEEHDLSHGDGAEEDQDHFGVHHVMAAMPLLNHAVSEPVRFLGAVFTPVYVVPVEGCRGRRLRGWRGVHVQMQQASTGAY